MSELSDLQFCHLVVGVADMDRALSFYRGLLGMDVVFDRLSPLLFVSGAATGWPPTLSASAPRACRPG